MKKDEKIPRIIHYVWLGGAEKSDLIKKCIESWHSFCDDYEIIEWDEDKLKSLVKNDYFMEALENEEWAFASDYARLWIVYNYGGVYLDTDVEIVRNIDELLKEEAFFCAESESIIATGVGFGASKSNLIVKKMLELYDGIHFCRDGEKDRTPCPIRNTEAVKEFLCGKQITDIIRTEHGVFLPKDYFCPLDYDSGIIHMTLNTYAIHWYGQSWLSGLKRFRKSLLRIMRRVIGEKRYIRLKARYGKC